MTIKIWKPYENKPIGQLEEDDPITRMTVYDSRSDMDVLYATNSDLHCLSLKHGKSVVLSQSNDTISALVVVE